ncbi:MAG: B12-binding domain-containing radical SAM protein [Thermodesulfobacteriota bacterium]
MKVLLILPPSTLYPGDVHFASFPLGVGYLAAILERDGHQVDILDCVIEDQTPKRNRDGTFHVGLWWQDIEQAIRKYSPEMLGISCSYSVDINNAKKIAKIAKRIANIPVIIGGAHSCALPRETLEDDNIDYVAIGEGEETLSLLVKSIESGEEPAHIDGLGYKRNGELIVNPKKQYISQLDKLPLPARHLFSMDKYINSRRVHGFQLKRTPYTTMITSRGCPNRCVFCAIHTIWGRKWRSRDPINVVDEIEHLVKAYGIKEIHFEDDNISLSKTRMAKICDEIVKRKLDISWATPNGISVNTLDKELIAKMKKSGCYRLFLAIESGNQFVLDHIIQKGLSLEKVKDVNRILREFDIEVNGCFVIGLPGEKREHIQDTIDFAKRLDLDTVGFSIATPYPGSALYDMCKDNIISNDFSNFRLNIATMNTEFLSSKEIEKLRNKAYLQFQINKFLKHPFEYLTTKQNYKTIQRYAKRIVGAKMGTYA